MQRAWVFVVLVLAGCSLFEPAPFPSSKTTSTTVERTPRDEAPNVIEQPAVRPGSTLKPAAAALIEQAREESDKGQAARAGAALENAIRIDPEHPAPWLALAELRFSENNLGPAENLARRALNLATRGSAEARAANALLTRIQSAPR
ncbi:MAG: tetratricopeptide repeat protein [Pseudomonadota bacterium]